MNVFHVFLTVFLTGCADCSSISDVLNNPSNNISLNPILVALLTGPRESFKYFMLSSYGNEILLERHCDSLINEAFFNYAQIPRFFKEAEETILSNLVNHAFPLLKQNEGLIKKDLASERDLWTKNIAAYIDRKVFLNFRSDIKNGLSFNSNTVDFDFKGFKAALIDGLKSHFPPAEDAILENLEIIFDSSPKLLYAAVEECSNVCTSISDYVTCLAKEIIAAGLEESLDESFKWLDLSDDRKFIRIISQTRDQPNSYPHAKAGWDRIFMSTMAAVYSKLLDSNFERVPLLDYHWKLFEGESKYSKARKRRVQACQSIKSTLNYIQTIQGGEFNQVYLVIDEETLTEYAHKIFINFSEFCRECKSSEILNHPYIVKSYGCTFDQFESRFEILFEYIKGSRSDKYAKTATKEQLKLISAQLFLGLEHLHAIGIVHGDLKPANVMVTKYGIVKIIDFGFSFKSPGTRKHVGTPMTMAPELCNLVPGELHEAVDWWAYGATIAIWFGSNRLFNRDHKSGFYPLTYEYRSKQYVEGHVPSEFPEDLRHFLAIFFQPDPECRRLNTLRQLQKIRNHPFFNGIDWSQLEGGILNKSN